MIKYFVAILILILALIITGTFVGLKLNNSMYFKDVIKEENPEIKFFIKKHTIFRFFAIVYSVIHYSLNVISVTASFITVYMIMDATIELNIQIFFLLTTAITTNLILGFRIDKISESYARAMRILEYAILKYSLEKDINISILYEANQEAEQHIENNFF